MKQKIHMTRLGIEPSLVISSRMLLPQGHPGSEEACEYKLQYPQNTLQRCELCVLTYTVLVMSHNLCVLTYTVGCLSRVGIFVSFAKTWIYWKN